jgi:hypothetical protein
MRAPAFFWTGRRGTTETSFPTDVCQYRCSERRPCRSHHRNDTASGTASSPEGIQAGFRLLGPTARREGRGTSLRLGETSFPTVTCQYRCSERRPCRSKCYIAAPRLNKTSKAFNGARKGARICKKKGPVMNGALPFTNNLMNGASSVLII